MSQVENQKKRQEIKRIAATAIDNTNRLRIKLLKIMNGNMQPMSDSDGMQGDLELIQDISRILEKAINDIDTWFGKDGPQP